MSLKKKPNEFLPCVMFKRKNRDGDILDNIFLRKILKNQFNLIQKNSFLKNKSNKEQ